MEKLISLKPPNSVGLALRTSVFHRLDSAYMEYIRYRELANRAASSPPAPPRISTMTFLSSLGSLGSRRIFSSSLHRSIDSWLDLYCSSTISLKSLSRPPSFSISLASSKSCWYLAYSRYFSTMGVRVLCSFIKDLNRSLSLTTLGSANCWLISS